MASRGMMTARHCKRDSAAVLQYTSHRDQEQIYQSKNGPAAVATEPIVCAAYCILLIAYGLRRGSTGSQNEKGPGLETWAFF